MCFFLEDLRTFVPSVLLAQIKMGETILKEHKNMQKNLQLKN